MLLISHIIIALAGLGLGVYSLLKASKYALHMTYVLGAATLLSGILLLIEQPSHVASACIAGLIYFALLGMMIFAARLKITALPTYKH